MGSNYQHLSGVQQIMSKSSRVWVLLCFAVISNIVNSVLGIFVEMQEKGHLVVCFLNDLKQVCWGGNNYSIKYFTNLYLANN